MHHTPNAFEKCAHRCETAARSFEALALSSYMRPAPLCLPACCLCVPATRACVLDATRHAAAGGFSLVAERADQIGSLPIYAFTRLLTHLWRSSAMPSAAAARPPPAGIAALLEQRAAVAAGLVRTTTAGRADGTGERAVWSRLFCYGRSVGAADVLCASRLRRARPPACSAYPTCAAF